jgi:hypothetical protein
VNWPPRGDGYCRVVAVHCRSEAVDDSAAVADVLCLDRALGQPSPVEVSTDLARSPGVSRANRADQVLPALQLRL